MSYGEDDYIASARRQGQKLAAERARCVANLEEARAMHDEEVMDSCIQAIASIDQQGRDLNALYASHTTAQQAPEQRAKKR
jgi:hypothetical protein